VTVFAGRVRLGDEYPASAIVGTHVRDTTTVCQVGLLSRACPGSPEMPVYDQNPPSHLPPQPGSIPAQVVAYLALDADEVEAIAVELKSLRTQLEDHRVNALLTYSARPAVTSLRAENGTILYYRFSCVGLVQHCYERALGTPLVDEASLPLVPLSELIAIWPIASNERLRAALGLPGAGPWDVLLPGYVFHAVAQAGPRPFRLPFRAQTEHAVFPLPAALAPVEGSGAPALPA
jgi:hypothetical protein